MQDASEAGYSYVCLQAGRGPESHLSGWLLANRTNTLSMFITANRAIHMISLSA
jgi:hypothetical protein